ncbi:UDP-N-acetylmuramoyl-L-alanyl-D-glutamate--2,6-diaminopimelate ligase [Candidatus Gugararchaeum adminiculabundum]|nr:UDP-N-acetylmuramoyl-L-alanyl-D-glutamate--2,6-diaminopimelate ligase [Candidatus Gugararchaeum adminiculabundum]
MKYSEMIRELYSFRRPAGENWNLEKITELCSLLGNPERKFPSLHVTGTNGKGSVVAMGAGILREAGFKVGAYFSPDVDGYEERFQINGKPVSKEKIAEVYERIRPSVLKVRGISFFEITTAIAFQLFADEKVDYAVLETGLGGRLDATNLCDSKVCVITNVSIEHTDLLGKTIEEIAREKAGIIRKKGSAVVTGAEGKALAVIEKRCEEIGCELQVVAKTQKYEGKIGLRGEFQKTNAALAIEAVKALGIKVGEKWIEAGISEAFLPARMETVSEKPLVIMDGTHNPAAMKVLAGEIKRMNEKDGAIERKAIVVFGIMKDKDCEGVLKELAPVAEMIIVTQPKVGRARDAEEVAEKARKVCKKVVKMANSAEAFAYAKKQAGGKGFVLVTGSFYLIGEIRGKKMNIDS